MEGRERSATDRVAYRMSAHVPASRSFRTCVILLVCATAVTCSSVPHDQDSTPVNHPDDALDAKKIELFEGVSVKIPKEENATDTIMSFEIDTTKDVATATGRGKQKKLMERILPMFIMPFLIQSTIVPFFLSMLKFMLFKSLMVGKLALGLILLNAFRNHNTFKGRHDEEVASIHYGYHGDGLEYGAYVN